MPGHKDSFANKIRTAAKKLMADPFGYADLSSTAELKSAAEEKQMRSAMCDFIKRGEVLRLEPGKFQYLGRKNKQQVEKRMVMWQVLKMRRIVTVVDLQELAGVTEGYAQQWLNSLVKNKVARKINGKAVNKPCKWQLLKDLAEMPEDEARKKKYRQIRHEKKKTLHRVLDRIQTGLDKARILAEEI